MKLYRLSKYDPDYRSYDDKYNVDTWTSFSDIGKSFNGNVLTLEQYLKIEEQYVAIIEDIIREGKIEIKNLDINVSFSDINEMFNLTGIKNDKEMYAVFSKMERQKYQIKERDIKILIKMALREFADFTLCSEDKKIKFGYDFYCYIMTKKSNIKIGKQQGIFIEELNKENCSRYEDLVSFMIAD